MQPYLGIPGMERVCVRSDNQRCRGKPHEIEVVREPAAGTAAALRNRFHLPLIHDWN
jgi:hypothetical protein